MLSNETSITYTRNNRITSEELSLVFERSGIKRPTGDLQRLQRMIENADILVGAYDQNKLVGVARALTDFSYSCYLSDLAVDEQYQKLGIGKKLITLVQEQISDEVTLLLLSSPLAMSYYPRLGFKRVDNAYMMPRQR